MAMLDEGRSENIFLLLSPGDSAGNERPAREKRGSSRPCFLSESLSLSPSSPARVPPRPPPPPPPSKAGRARTVRS